MVGQAREKETHEIESTSQNRFHGKNVLHNTATI